MGKTAKKIVKVDVKAAKAKAKPVVAKAASKTVAKPPVKAAVKVAEKTAKKVIKVAGKVLANLKAKPKKAEKPIPAKKELVAKLVKKEVLKPVAKIEIEAKKAKGKPAGKLPKGKIEKIVEVELDAVVEVKGKQSKKEKKLLEKVNLLARRCREPGCENEKTLGSFCRLHYIKNWRKIKRKEAIIGSGQLNNYVEELASKYPDKYLDVIRQDLASEKEWAKSALELELDANDDEAVVDEDLEPSADGGGRRAGGAEFDDDSDSF